VGKVVGDVDVERAPSFEGQAHSGATIETPEAKCVYNWCCAVLWGLLYRGSDRRCGM
jgi:hypothetical protein